MRQPNRRPTIYHGADGWYHAWLSVGRRGDGRLDRRHVRGRTGDEVVRKLARLEDKLRAGHVPEVGIAPSVATWLEHWLGVVAPRRVRPSTLQGYASKIRCWIIPGLGAHRLDRLRPEHVESFYGELERQVAAATALQVHRILARALRVAVQRGLLMRNPCDRDLLDPPTAPEPRTRPLLPAELQAVLAAAVGHEPARWWVALALGLRQGEALGLFWDYVDLDADPPTLAIHWALARRAWRHGCGRVACGRRPASCPRRTGGGLVFEAPKSSRSRRVLPLPTLLVDLFREHRRNQLEQRMAAGSMWQRITGPDGENGGLVFPAAFGQPRDPRADWGAWKALLARAGVRDARLHDARHTAATTMFVAGMERRELMEWLGHSQIGVSARYTHVDQALMARRAQRLDDALRDLVQPDMQPRRRRRRSS